MEELKKIIEDIQTAFQEYKNTNDARIALVEKGVGTGAETEKLAKLEEKLQELETSKGELEAKINRANKPEAKDVQAQEHKDAFLSFVRKGDISGLEALEKKTTMNITTGSDGGYAIPQLMASSILQLLGYETPMRGICGHISTSSEDYSQLVNLGGAGSGWVGEADARSQTTAPTLAQVKAIFGEIYANPFVTQRALDDIFFDVESYLSGEVAKEFASKENTAFTKGDGTNKPKGLFAYTFTSTADSSRAFGTFQFVKSGAASTLGTSPGDCLIELQDTLKSGYKVGARWMFNSATLTAIRQVKDSQNNYIWQPGITNGTPNTVLGYSYVINPDMDNIAANALPIAFGDFARAYAVVDRVGIRMLRDPYTSKPNVGFYTTKRVGSLLLDTQAVKAIKVSA